MTRHATTNTAVLRVPTDTEVRVDKVIVTPDLAREWLKRNTHNRPIWPNLVETLARQMREGKFPVNGDTIRFDINEVLLDGQHRLMAQVKSDSTLTAFVVSNLPPEVHVTIDQGRRRSAADTLNLENLPYATGQSALANLCLRIERNLDTGTTKYRASNGEVLDYVQGHPEVLDAVAFATGLCSRRSFRDAKQTLIAYTYMEMAKLDPGDAENLWQAVADMTPLYQGDPALALARRLAELRRNRSRLSEPVMLDLVFRTWNKRRKTAQLLKLPMREVPNFAEVTRPI